MGTESCPRVLGVSAMAASLASSARWSFACSICSGGDLGWKTPPEPGFSAAQLPGVVPAVQHELGQVPLAGGSKRDELAPLRLESLWGMSAEFLIRQRASPGFGLDERGHLADELRINAIWKVMLVSHVGQQKVKGERGCGGEAFDGRPCQGGAFKFLPTCAQSQRECEPVGKEGQGAAFQPAHPKDRCIGKRMPGQVESRSVVENLSDVFHTPFVP